MIILRVVSYGFDLRWLHNGYRQLSDEKLAQEGDQWEWSLKARIEKPQEKTDFTLITYFAYIFYFPLNIAGPILTFNSFISQVISPNSPNLLDQSTLEDS